MESSGIFYRPDACPHTERSEYLLLIGRQGSVLCLFSRGETGDGSLSLQQGETEN